MRLFWIGVVCVVAGLVACSPMSNGPDGGTGGGGGSGGGGGGAGNCAPAAKTPPNLVPNNGFECGDMGWSPQGTGTLSVDSDARTGSQSARLVAMGSPAAGRFSLTLPVVAAASGKTYCAQAYFKGTVSDAQLSVLESTTGGVVDHTFSTPVASTTWIRTPPSTNLEVRAAAGAKLYVRLVMHRNPKVNDTLLVDDVDVWESADGLCKEVR